MQEKKVTVKMDEFVEELKKNPSSRFSKADFQMLVYGGLSDSGRRVQHRRCDDEVFGQAAAARRR